MTTSDATGAARLALFTVAHAAREDNVLADRSKGVAELAELAAIDPKTFGRQVKALCAAGDLVYFSAPGRGRTPVFVVTCGLSGDDRERAMARAEELAGEWGGRYDVTLCGAVEVASKRGRAVTFSWSEKGDIWSRKGDGSSRKGDGSSPFPPIRDSPDSRSPDLEQQQHARGEGEGPPEPARLSPEASDLRGQLLGLGVWPQPADRIVRSYSAEWVRRVLAAARWLRSQGAPADRFGAVVVAMADGEVELPAVPVVPAVPAARPEAGRSASVGRPAESPSPGTPLDEGRREELRRIQEEARRDALASGPSGRLAVPTNSHS